MTQQITITKEEGRAVDYATHRIITNAEEMKEAVEVLSQLNSTLDRITTEKEKVTKPLLEALKQERLRFKPFEEKFEHAIESIRRVMTNYQTEQKRITAEKEIKIVERIKPGKGNLTKETGIKKMDEIERPEDKITTIAGTVGFKTVDRFEVTNITEIPYAYLLVNEVEVRKALKNGVKLPGIHYFTEEIPVNRR